MKTLFKGCALAALVLCVGGQVDAKTHAAKHPSKADAADAAATDPAPTADESGSAALAPEEAAFFTALGHRLTDAATAYQAYVSRASALDGRFANGQSVQAALKVGEDYNPHQLQEGVVAYAAVLALRNQTFVEGVRAQARASQISGLIDQPDAVLRIRGADQAAMEVSATLRAQAQALLAAGRLIHQAAYTVQHQAWSKASVSEPARVLASAKALAARVSAADDRAKRRLLDSLAAAPMSGPAGSAPAPEVVQGLALAAVAILGGAGDGQEARLEPLLQDARGSDCLAMAKMNLNQCLAVAGPQYEDVFCLGQHAVEETGQCLAAASGRAPAYSGSDRGAGDVASR